MKVKYIRSIKRVSLSRLLGWLSVTPPAHPILSICSPPNTFNTHLLASPLLSISPRAKHLIYPSSLCPPTLSPHDSVPSPWCAKNISQNYLCHISLHFLHSPLCWLSFLSCMYVRLDEYLDFWRWQFVWVSLSMNPQSCFQLAPEFIGSHSKHCTHGQFTKIISPPNSNGIREKNVTNGCVNWSVRLLEQLQIWG